RAQPSGAARSTTATPSEDLAALSAEDRATFARARAERDAARVQAAWTIAAPLFGKYPDVHAVQDLRCQLAMQRGLTSAQFHAECDRLMQLTPGAAEWWRK